MQQGKLFKIEEAGVWLAFWGLLAAILVQLVLGMTFGQVIGEVCVFAALSVYLSFASLKNGLWAKSMAASRKANALFSLVPAAAVGVLSAVKAFVISHNEPRAALLLQLAATVVVVYAGCFAALEATRLIWRKKRDALDDTEE